MRLGVGITVNVLEMFPHCLAYRVKICYDYNTKMRRWLMSKLQEFKEKCQELWVGSEPARKKTGAVFSVIGKIFKGIGAWIYRLRSVFLAVPVALAALRLAAFNRENLPEMVGIDLQATGQYSYVFEQETVIMWPLLITAACLVLMCLSRRVVYPWIISIFTLAIPILIYVTNVFPA